MYRTKTADGVFTGTAKPDLAILNRLNYKTYEMNQRFGDYFKPVLLYGNEKTYMCPLLYLFINSRVRKIFINSNLNNSNAEYIKLIKILTNESLRKRTYAHIIVKIGDALVSSNIEQHIFHSFYYAPGNLSRDGQRIDFVFNPGDKEIRKGPNTIIIDLTADYYKVLEYKKSLQTK